MIRFTCRSRHEHLLLLWHISSPHQGSVARKLEKEHGDRHTQNDVAHALEGDLGEWRGGGSKGADGPQEQHPPHYRTNVPPGADGTVDGPRVLGVDEWGDAECGAATSLFVMRMDR